MLNEFERRFLEVVENRRDLMAAIRATGSNVRPESFGYQANFGAFAGAGATLQQVIVIQSDSWFVAHNMSCGVILPNGSTFGDLTQVRDPGNILLQVTDTGTGEDLYSQPAGFAGFPAATMTGAPLRQNTGIPYLFPIPRLIPPNTNILVTMTQFGVTALTNPLPVAAHFMLNGARVPLGSEL